MKDLLIHPEFGEIRIERKEGDGFVREPATDDAENLTLEVVFHWFNVAAELCGSERVDG